MNYWIVKGRPSENDFDAWLRPQKTDRWHTAKPPADWAAGDRLFFWKAAPDLCVVGLGEFVRSERRQPQGTPTRFWVRYLSPSLTKPAGITRLRSDRVIGRASFLKSGPSSTLYPLTVQQGERLFALIRRSNPFVAEVWRELGDTKPAFTDIDLLDASAPEGARRLVNHLRIERDRRLIEMKKRNAQSTGSLSCEVCGFDFEQRYGALGRGFCEVHHRSALAAMATVRTTLSDLAIVCSNCHRMLHRGKTALSILRLRQQLQTET